MTDKPTIDYTNKDYTSLRTAMLELARYRLPEWTDHNPGDLGVLLVDLFAYMGDVVLYYQDRIANESFLHTAVERRSVMHLLRLIGYELRPPISASADLQLTFRPPGGGPAVATITNGSEFRSTIPQDSPQTFAYLGPDLTVNLGSDQVVPNDDGSVGYSLPVRHSRAIATETIGSSTGEPNQRFALAQAPLILDSLQVEVDEGAGWVPWERRESLLFQLGDSGRIGLSTPDARHCYVQYDEDGVAWVHFGDGVYGRRPPAGTNNIRARYRVGGGSAGNVAAGAITESLGSIVHLEAVTNPRAAAGGEDAESADHGARFGPLAFRSGQRAVTASDYVALAHQAGGVAKAHARSLAWSGVDLYIAPEGTSCRPVPEGLRRRLSAFFEDRRMAGTFVRILDAHCVPVDVGVEIIADPHYPAQGVRQAVHDAIADLLAFDRVDFGQSLYQNDLLAALDPLPGVLSINVTRFGRQDAPVTAVDQQLREYDLPPLDRLPAFLQRAVMAEIGAEGRVQLEEYELPAAGLIDVSVRVAGS